MAFQQGLSGLNMSAKALDAVGNNIANAQTVGFKSAVAQFADVYAATIGGASSANLIGQGGSIMSVSQLFTQGNVTSTNNPLDIAINGNGFLRFQPTLNDLTPQYSRNGQLHLNSEGYLVNALDQFLCVYPATVGGDSINTSAAVPLQLSNAQLEPKQTGWSSVAGGTIGGVSVGANLDVRDKRALGATDTGWTPVSAFAFNPATGEPTPDMYNFSTSATIYDQTGQPHVMTMYFIRQGDPLTGATQRQWEPRFILDNKYEIPATDLDATVTDSNLMMFTPSGQISNDALNNAVSAKRFTLDLASAFDGTGTVDLTSDTGVALFDPATPLEFDFSTMTQYGSAYDVNKLTQDGYGPGRLSGIAIDGEGKITARYSNGKTKLQGQIMLSTFQNPNGLVPLGNNLWAPSSASGEALDGTPMAGSRGSIQAGAVEDANVDLTQELVNMITLQRSYQANAQTIKTQDQILQTLVNLR
ncbi:MAG: flagellar hook protein FlgE [Rhodocyclaceae bacterium]|nr:flagellar hook protein FlgE [Rhodocyclaceae bacterium]MDZ4215235.1 flagellar hook protein FlgE [Rhodocyclaceae bacterium]